MTTPESLGKRLLRGAIGGFVAGLVFIGVTMWFVTITGGPANQPLNLISSLGLGADALQNGGANPLLGFVIHSVLSIVFGMIFALFVPLFKTNGTVAAAGGLFGIALFVINFLILAQTVVTQFKAPNLAFELLAHAVFGHLLAFAFYSSGIRETEPVMAIGDNVTPARTVT